MLSLIPHCLLAISLSSVCLVSEARPPRRFLANVTHVVMTDSEPNVPPVNPLPQFSQSGSSNPSTPKPANRGHAVPNGEALSGQRLEQTKTDLAALHEKLRLINGNNTGASGTSIVSVLEQLLNNKAKTSSVGSTGVSAPDTTPNWYITPPPLPTELVNALPSDEGSEVDTDINQAPTTDFMPAGKQLPQFAPKIHSTDSDVIKVANQQAGDGGFNWLLPYKEPLQVPSLQSRLLGA